MWWTISAILFSNYFLTIELQIAQININNKKKQNYSLVDPKATTPTEIRVVTYATFPGIKLGHHTSKKLTIISIDNATI